MPDFRKLFTPRGFPLRALLILAAALAIALYALGMAPRLLAEGKTEGPLSGPLWRLLDFLLP